MAANSSLNASQHEATDTTSPVQITDDDFGDDHEGLGHYIPSLRIQMAMLLSLLMLYTLYFAKDFFLPIVLAIVLNLLLSPVVRWLSKLHVPRGVSAMMVIWVFIGLSAGLVNSLATPATEWFEKTQEIFGQLQKKSAPLLESMEQVTEATKTIEGIAAEVLDEEPATRNQVEVTVATEGDWKSSALTNARSFMGSTIIVLSLLFFLLSTGDMMMRKLAGLFSSTERQAKAVEVAAAVQHEISRYLLSITIINVCLGLIVGSILWVLGMPNPFLWGALLSILNFVPYVGSIATAAIVLVVSVVTFDTLPAILLPPLIMMFCSSVEGMVITPFLLGFRLSLNPVLIFISILFWGWLWGIVGVLLAVPLLAIAKVSADRIGGKMRPWAQLLSS